MSETPTSYSLLVMFKDVIYAVRDPYGNRPLCIGRIVPVSKMHSSGNRPEDDAFVVETSPPGGGLTSVFVLFFCGQEPARRTPRAGWCRRSPAASSPSAPSLFQPRRPISSCAVSDALWVLMALPPCPQVLQRGLTGRDRPDLAARRQVSERGAAARGRPAGLLHLRVRLLRPAGLHLRGPDGLHGAAALRPAARHRGADGRRRGQHRAGVGDARRTGLRPTGQYGQRGKEQRRHTPTT